MRATALIPVIAAAIQLLALNVAFADDSGPEATDRIAQLLKIDASKATSRASQELSALDNGGQLGVCTALLARVSEFVKDASDTLTPLDLPKLTWPGLPSDSTELVQQQAAEAAASRYGEAVMPHKVPNTNDAVAVVQLVMDCVDGHLAAGDRSPEWIEIAEHTRRLHRELLDVEMSSTLRAEVVPAMAEANLALLQAAALVDDGSVDDVGGRRGALVRRARTAVARCLPHVKSAETAVQADFRHAIQSLVAIDPESSSRAMDLLVALSATIEHSSTGQAGEGRGAPQPVAANLLPSPENNRLLLLNRLTRDPSNINLLREFTDSIRDEADAPDQDALEAARTVLANAVYRVDEACIPELLSRLEQLEAVARCLQDADDSVAKDTSEPVDIASSIDDATDRLRSLQQDLAAFTDSRSAIREGIERLSVLIDDPSATPDQRSRANTVLSTYVEAEQARNTLHYLSASCARLEDLRASGWPTANLDEAVSVLNASEQLLTSLWGLSRNATCGAVKDRCEELPRLLTDYREQILYAKSRDGLAAIADKAQQTEKLGTVVVGVPVNDSLKKLESLVRAAEGDFVRLPSSKAQTTAQPMLQKMQAAVVELRREQLNRYQHLVIAKCKSVLERFDDQWYCTEGEALRYFKRYELATVDQSLLTPEVSRCFNDCIGKLFSKMKPRNLVDCEEAMGRPEDKLKLESF